MFGGLFMSGRDQVRRPIPHFLCVVGFLFMVEIKFSERFFHFLRRVLLSGRGQGRSAILHCLCVVGYFFPAEIMFAGSCSIDAVDSMENNFGEEQKPLFWIRRRNRGSKSWFQCLATQRGNIILF